MHKTMSTHNIDPRLQLHNDLHMSHIRVLVCSIQPRPVFPPIYLFIFYSPTHIPVHKVVEIILDDSTILKDNVSTLSRLYNTWFAEPFFSILCEPEMLTDFVTSKLDFLFRLLLRVNKKENGNLWNSLVRSACRKLSFGVPCTKLMTFRFSFMVRMVRSQYRMENIRSILAYPGNTRVNLPLSVHIKCHWSTLPPRMPLALMTPCNMVPYKREKFCAWSPPSFWARKIQTMDADVLC